MNLRRWVASSIVYHLSQKNIDVLVGAFSENNPEDDGLKEGETHRIEFRLDGPETYDRTNRRERHHFELNFLVSSSKQNNVYASDNYLDRIRAEMVERFCIFKIDEDHLEPPFEVVGVLKIEKTWRRPIRVHNMLSKKPGINLIQGVVKARYYMDLLK